MRARERQRYPSYVPDGELLAPPVVQLVRGHPRLGRK